MDADSWSGKDIRKEFVREASPWAALERSAGGRELGENPWRYLGSSCGSVMIVDLRQVEDLEKGDEW